MSELHNYECNHGGPATAQELIAIDQAVRHAMDGIQATRQALRSIRRSDEAMATLETIRGLEMLLKYHQQR